MLTDGVLWKKNTTFYICKIKTSNYFIHPNLLRNLHVTTRHVSDHSAADVVSQVKRTRSCRKKHVLITRVARN